MEGVSAELQAWRRKGAFFLWRGRRIFVARGGQGPRMLLIHGYPTGSFDWHRMWRGLGEHFDLIAPDLLGLGYSDKPHTFSYSLADHADMVEDLLDHVGCSHVHVMAHDLGVSVAQELLARQLESRRSCTIESLVLLNGGLCPEAYRPRLIQRLLASRIGAWLGPRVPRWAFDRSIRTLFGPHAAPSESLLEDFWSLVEHNEGLSVAHVVGRFWIDRMERRDRLLAPLLPPAVPTRLINGGADPNSGHHMAQRYRALVPHADIVSLGQVGHWPQLEAPQAVLDATLSFFDREVGALIMAASTHAPASEQSRLLKIRSETRRGRSMALSHAFARGVALIGAAAIQWRRRHGRVREPAVGAAPTIPAPRPQGRIPTLKMPTALGWAAGQVPVAATGLRVNAFADGLKHPRWIHVLPNGDVTVAEALFMPAPARSLFELAMHSTMKRAAAIGPSPNRITLLRDADGDGVAETREPFLQGLSQPFGMALVGDTFYVGNTDGLVAFPYAAGQTRITAPARPLMAFKPRGHWTRSLLASADGQRLYVGVGSLSNIAEAGMAVEAGRACIVEVDLASGRQRIFASGLRNPVGLAWEPMTGMLWTVVNERDGLGDETPPDYLTSVQDGGFYGWPFCYWGRTVDDRVPQDPARVATALTPDYALGGHTASLGLCWMPAGTLPGFPDGMVVGQHGSWNRSTLSGYRVVFVPFEGGRPAGPPRDILSGFLVPDESVSYGRPVGVVVGPDRRSLLVADDVGDVIWRVSAAG